MQANMVECRICFAEYQEEDLELHRAKCMPHLLFRCTLCYEDYMNKEGLWNHMNLHEITDESKELHCHEITAEEKFSQCSLCQDQRAYLESHYWDHIQDAHDLRSYGKNDASTKLGNDHGRRDSRDTDQMVTSESDDYVVDQKSAANDTDDIDFKTEEIEEIAVVPLDGRSSDMTAIKASQKVQNATKEQRQNSENTTSSNLLAENINEQISNLHNEAVTSNVIEKVPSACTYCGNEYASSSYVYRHVNNYHKQKKCSICGETLLGLIALKQHLVTCHAKENQLMKVPIHGQLRFECEICGRRFKFQHTVNDHKMRDHPNKGDLRNVQTEPKQNRAQEVAVEEIPSLSHDSQDQSMVVNPSTEVNVNTFHKHANDHVVFSSSEQSGRQKQDGSEEISASSSQTSHRELTKHPEVNHKCSYCSKKFHTNMSLKQHESGCAVRKGVCRVCGGKRYETSRNTDLEDMDCSEEQYVEKTDSTKSTAGVSREDSTLSLPGGFHGIKITATENKRPRQICAHCSREQRYHTVVGPQRNTWRYCCDICGRYLNSRVSVVRHIKTAHPDKGRLIKIRSSGIKQQQTQNEKNAFTQDITGEETNSNLMGITECPMCGEIFDDQHLLSKHVEATHQMTICGICGKTFAGDELMDHKLICPQQRTTIHDDSNFGVENISMLQTDSVNRPQDDDIDLKMEIYAEGTILQESQVPNDDRTKSITTTLSSQLENHDKSKDVEDAPLENEIKPKEDTEGEYQNQPVPVNMPQDDDIELKMEIHAEGTMLQESQVPNDGRAKSITTTLSSQLENHNKSKDVKVEDAPLENRIKPKEKDPKGDYQNQPVPKIASETTERHKVPNDQNEFLVRHTVAEQLGSCSICGLTFETKSKMDYHMVVVHTEPQYKCSQCPKAFHFIDTHRRHEKLHMRM